MIEFDPNKSSKNIEKHGVSLADAAEFEFEDALVVVDDRKAYGEVRYAALGFIGDRLHHLTFTVRGKSIRAISLRRANRREVKLYEQA